jgi:hypothetical protein
MVRDARRCRAPHHEDLILKRRGLRPISEPHPEEARSAVSKDARQQDMSATPSRRDAPEFCKFNGPQKRAQGRPGARCTRGLACKSIKKTHTSIQVQRKHSGLPCAMVLRLISCSPWRPAFLSPSPRRKSSTRLDASIGAPGPHDFAVRFTRCSSKAHRRPPHPAPNVRDDRETPLIRDGMARNEEMIWPGREAEYFCARGWTVIPADLPDDGQQPHQEVLRLSFTA